jgi:hypothetical protein
MPRDDLTLNQLTYELETWRALNSAPTPIPPRIWSEAARVGGKLGFTRVSKALKLSSSRLKRLACDGVPLPPTTFVELLPLPAQNLGDCALEIESSRGARMRIQIQNATSSGLASLIRDFLA